MRQREFGVVIATEKLRDSMCAIRISRKPYAFFGEIHSFIHRINWVPIFHNILALAFWESEAFWGI